MREDCLKQRKSLIFESVLSSDGKVDFINRAKLAGYFIQKSILNCKTVSGLVDRLYVYDNSLDGVDARLLFRMADGKLVKRYFDDIPEWSEIFLLT